MIMKKYAVVILVILLSGPGTVMHAQKAQKSSGVIKLNMKKPASARNETMPVVVPMEQETVYELNGEKSSLTWITPTLSSVKTSESTFRIEATIHSEAVSYTHLRAHET